MIVATPYRASVFSRMLLSPSTRDCANLAGYGARPDFKYDAAAQLLDRGLPLADPLPAIIKARIKQISPYTNGAGIVLDFRNFYEAVNANNNRRTI